MARGWLLEFGFLKKRFKNQFLQSLSTFLIASEMELVYEMNRNMTFLREKVMRVFVLICVAQESLTDFLMMNI
jgi:hypothetical protein